MHRSAEGGGPTKKIAWPALVLLAIICAAMPAAAATAPGSAADDDETKIAIPDSTAGAAGSSASAGDTAGAPAGTARAPGVNTWDFVRMLLVLAAVVACIYGLVWLLRRGSRPRTPENESIRLLASRSLGGNRALHLVEVGRDIYLVGAAESGVSLVAEVKDQESIDAIRVQAAEEGGPRRRTFAETLSRVFSPGTRGPRTGPAAGGAADILRRSRDRLRRLGGGS